MNVLKVGDDENYLKDIMTANVTIPSLNRFEGNIRDLDPRLLDVNLPMPKMCERTKGRKEVETGFIGRVTRIPKALVALLTWKV